MGSRQWVTGDDDDDDGGGGGGGDSSHPCVQSLFSKFFVTMKKNKIHTYGLRGTMPPSPLLSSL
jgi:hypothetical protein